MALRFVQIVVVGRNNSMGRKGDDFRNFSISIALYKRNGFLKFFNFYDNSCLSFQIYIFFLLFTYTKFDTSYYMSIQFLMFLMFHDFCVFSWFFIIHPYVTSHTRREDFSNLGIERCEYRCKMGRVHFSEYHSFEISSSIFHPLVSTHIYWNPTFLGWAHTPNGDFRDKAEICCPPLYKWEARIARSAR